MRTFNIAKAYIIPFIIALTTITIAQQSNNNAFVFNGESSQLHIADGIAPDPLDGAVNPDAHRRGGLLLTLLSALGRNIAPEQWDVLLAGPLSEPSAVASPALRYVLRDAAANGRLGETVLLALLGLGAGGPEKAGLVTLGDAVAALRTVGLERDAEAIAVEAALAGGL